MKRKKSNGLIIFVKNPVAGKVKTRIARSVGDQQALEVYQALLSHTRTVTSQVKAERILFYEGYIDTSDVWPADLYRKELQLEGDIGTKMSDALDRTLNLCDVAILIGSDIIQLTPAILELAFDRLQRFDVVIGPALDGGYYLIGMKEYHRFVFADMEWSTDTVFEETLSRILRADLSCHVLPALSDVDEWQDWVKYGGGVEC